MNDEPRQKPSVSIDFGAKASLEVKAEIPSAATGKLVEALTDIIRPFTEKRGLKADLIRLQREEVAVRVVKLARERIEAEAQSIKPMPAKFLSRLLESCSLEEPNSPLVDWWAGLLVAGATQGPVRPYLVDLMSKIGDEEAEYLDERWSALCNGGIAIYDRTEYGMVYQKARPSILITPMLGMLRQILLDNLELKGKSRPLEARKRLRAFAEQAAMWGDELGMSVRVSFLDSEISCSSRSYPISHPVIDVCKALNLLDFVGSDTVGPKAMFDPDGEVEKQYGSDVWRRHKITVWGFTELGTEFMQACKPTDHLFGTDFANQKADLREGPFFAFMFGRWDEYFAMKNKDT
ncbi:MAG: hypothetical protein GC182_15580 [Rhodopseudomonas sp.]|nr:hypothetical protein [Rhodopseudomonas sp.]